jgi:hypothetical protein
MSDQPKGLDALIASLQIFRKYGNPSYPTHCEHDEMRVNIDPELVSLEDQNTLKELGWTPEHGNPVFISYRFGSA